MASGSLKDYLGVGLASARPATPSLSTGVAGYWYATDTGVLSVWNGLSWTNVSSGGSSLNVQQAGSTVVTGATVLNFVSGATVGASGTTANVTIAGGGGGKWTLLNSWDFSVSGAISTLDTTSLTNDEILVVTQAVTKSSSGRPTLYFSTNNGTSYDTTIANYLSVSATGGAPGNSGVYMDTASTTGATSGQAIITALQESGPKIALPTSSNPNGYQYIGSALAINAVRVIPTGGGTFNGGKIFVYGRN